MLEISIILPCLDEAETLAICIQKASLFLAKNQVNGEIIVADNGSVDGSQAIAIKHGAVVVDVIEKGYGNAVNAGFRAAKGKYLIMGDADDSYDFSSLEPFLIKLREGNDLVMGNRFQGGIEKGAMPFLHYYLGNPVLSFIGRLFFKTSIGDFHCGLRGMSKSAWEQMDLRTTGMEFASEIVVKASLHNMQITEVPTTLSVDGRSRKPHLRTWPDGWRHLRFLLLYSPRWLFFYPSLTLFFLSLGIFLLLLSGPITVSAVTFDVHTLLYSAFGILISFQSILFFLFAKIYSYTSGLLPPNKKSNSFFNSFSLERGLIIGGLLVLTGIALTIYNLATWKEVSFGDLDPHTMLRLTIPAVLTLSLGFQFIFSSFMMSFLKLVKK